MVSAPLHAGQSDRRGQCARSRTCPDGEDARQAQAQTQDPRVSYRLTNIENLNLPAASFDLVYSSLALHYIPDFGAVCAAVRRLLTPAGALSFRSSTRSIPPPATRAANRCDRRQGVAVDSYLLEGPRVTDWITPGVVKQHRTLATYVNSLLEQGFRLMRLEEWGPPEQIAEQPDWAAEVHRPPFLLVGAQAQ